MIVDSIRNRLYLRSMVEGKVRILDRDTLELLRQIPHLFRDGKRFFASSTVAH